MRRFLAVLLLAVGLACSAAALAQDVNAIDPLPFRDAAQRERFQDLTRNLRCMVCQDESIWASNADFAKQMRLTIFNMMQQGQSDRQIKAWLVERYSAFILYDPPLAPSTIALWFGTPAILVIGGAVLVVLLRRRVRPARVIPDEPGDDW